MAGIIDGEGCITAESRMGYSLTNLWIAQQRTTKGRALVDWITENFGGKITEQSNSGKGVFKWFPGTNKNQVRVLLKCLPFMIVKKQQAKLAIGLLLTNKFVSKKSGHRGADEHVVRYRQLIVDFIQRFNQGIDPPAETECENLINVGKQLIQHFRMRQSTS